MLYWPDSDAQKLQRANIDGSEVMDLAVPHNHEFPRGIDLDLVNGKIYWTDGGPENIFRADLDGSNVETVIGSGMRDLRGIAVDALDGKLYFVDSILDKIMRSNLDGSDVEDLVLDTPYPWSLEIDTRPVPELSRVRQSRFL